MNKNLLTIILVIVVFCVTSWFSYSFFAKSSPRVTHTTSSSAGPSKSDGEISFDDSLPKTEPCPVNGVLYSKQQKDWWEKHRPLGVMIENHEESRPQSGLSSADVVYEAVAEGGITRFLTVFYCKDGGQIGPVRSARTYFIDFLSEYGDYPLYAHVGGANSPGPADALGQLTDYGWTGYNDLNQFSIGFPTFWRDYDRLGRTVATEHTMYSTTAKLWAFAKKDRDLTNIDKKGKQWDANYVAYSFKDDVDTAKRPTAQTIHLEFWQNKSEYFVDWVYDKAANVYKRLAAGKPHVDKNNNKQLTAKNLVVLLMNQSNANDGYENNLHLLYKTKGTGKAVIFMDGQKITGKWKKDSRTARTILYDAQGSTIKFNKGVIWFDVLPAASGVVEVK